MKLPITLKDCLTGILLYGGGDSLGALILGTFSLSRLLGMALVGATLYAVEIPAFFRWLHKQMPQPQTLGEAFGKGVIAQAYFNPLWVARHFFFIAIFSEATLSWDILSISLHSFGAILPVALFFNCLIQYKIPLQWRFFCSAAFSASMAVYYSLSEVYFSQF